MRHPSPPLHPLHHNDRILLLYGHLVRQNAIERFGKDKPRPQPGAFHHHVHHPPRDILQPIHQTRLALHRQLLRPPIVQELFRTVLAIASVGNNRVFCATVYRVV